VKHHFSHASHKKHVVVHFPILLRLAIKELPIHVRIFSLGDLHAPHAQNTQKERLMLQLPPMQQISLSPTFTPLPPPPPSPHQGGSRPNNVPPRQPPTRSLLSPHLDSSPTLRLTFTRSQIIRPRRKGLCWSPGSKTSVRKTETRRTRPHSLMDSRQFQIPRTPPPQRETHGKPPRTSPPHPRTGLSCMR